MLLGTQPVTNLVREGKTNQLRNAMQIALSAGHKTLEMSLNELVAAGIITQETAVATAFVPHEVDGANLAFRSRPRSSCSVASPRRLRVHDRVG